MVRQFVFFFRSTTTKLHACEKISIWIKLQVLQIVVVYNYNKKNTCFYVFKGFFRKKNNFRESYLNHSCTVYTF